MKRALNSKDSPSRPKARRQAFIAKYREEWPCLTQSKLGETYAHCDLCRADFSVAHAGRDDCRRHVASKKHLDYASLAKSAAQTGGIRSFFQSKETNHDVVRAEAMIVDLVVELNLPMTAADRISKSVKKMFKDSEIAKKVQCGRSKATAMVKEMSFQTQERLTALMRARPFTISTDGSNDSSSNKLFPLVVRTVDPETLEVRSDAYSLPECEGRATGENIFKLIDKALNDAKIPWDNCLALGSDNANVMVGKNKGVYGYMLSAHPSIYLSGCVCHLIHIAAEKGAACLPFSIDEILVDVYYYLDKSSKRQQLLQEMQVLHEVKTSKMLKHVTTRWLSVTRSLGRVLENWEALLAFFRAESSSGSEKSDRQTDRLQRLKNFFQSPTSRLYCLALQHILAVFDRYNLELQSEAPKIHILRRRLHSFVRDLFLMFVKPCAMAYKSVNDVQFWVSHNVKDAKDIGIGSAARAFLSDKSSNLREKRISEFFKNIKSLFSASCQYLCQKLPLKDEFLHLAEVIDISTQQEASFSSVRLICERFPCLVKDMNMDDLEREFCLYQVTDIKDFHKDRIDETWAGISKVKDENGAYLFKLLPQLMLSILTVPHSSAHCERIFSIVRKNDTEFRPNISRDTLQALIVAKSRPSCAEDRPYSAEDLKRLKGCYYQSLKQ